MNRTIATLVLLLTMSAHRAEAQCASLLGPPGQRGPLTLSDNSWYFQEIEPPKQIQRYDIITVIVKETSQYAADGEVDRRKRSNVDARLQDWILFRGGDLKPDPQSDGDPRIRASLNNQYRAESEMETSGILQFRISAQVVDIRSNGTLVLEAHRTVRNNNELWEQKLTGIVAREDILPNRTVLSEKVAELKIEKTEHGHIRDAYKRGWLQRWIDRWKAF
jgi:flagellar L-ring protein precursor FlgH